MHPLTDKDIAYVKMCAQKLKRRLPSHVELDDLIQDGMVGLVDAACKYDEAANANVPFLGYAYIRIQGAMIDGLRRMNTDRGIKEPYGLTPPEKGHHYVIDFEGLIDSEGERVEMLAIANRLEEPYRTVIVEHYLEEKSLTEIAEKMGKSVGRISQLHRVALIKLRGLFADGTD